ncbi:chorismate mutase [Streptomyces sp. NPDC002285]
MPKVTDGLFEDLPSRIVDLDRSIMELVRQRTELCAQLTAQRRAAGGPSIELARENEVLQRYGEALGRRGISLAMLLTELGRQ